MKKVKNMKQKKENTIIFNAANEHDILHTLKSKQYVFGDSDRASLPKRKYNKIIIKTNDGSGRNLIGYLNEVKLYDYNDTKQYWANVRCNKSLNWKGIITLDKVAEVSDEALNYLSDTMVPIKNKNGKTMYRGRNSGGSFGYCNSSFQNIK
jgi:hypothetical protein